MLVLEGPELDPAGLEGRRGPSVPGGEQLGHAGLESPRTAARAVLGQLRSQALYSEEVLPDGSVPTGDALGRSAAGDPDDGGGHLDVEAPRQLQLGVVDDVEAGWKAGIVLTGDGDG